MAAAGIALDAKPAGTVLAHREKRTCSACGSPDLELALDLPRLPITGVFLKAPARPGEFLYDQALCICLRCGHGQLRYCLAPEAVYDQTYFHRSSASGLARAGNEAFERFVRTVIRDRRFRCLLEVGANDLYLIERISDIAEARVAIDPIWKQEAPPARASCTVFGKFVEELSRADLPDAPDLIISVQTFEHVDEPAEQLSRLVDLAAPGALIFVEVPDFDSLLRNLRFDQVFHQHVQYYGLASLVGIFERLGCSYVAHSVNYRYWGGALGIAVQKGAPAAPSAPRPAKPSAAEVRKRYAAMGQLMAELMRQIDALPTRTVYGFGAAQMLPTLAYHMGSDLGFLTAVLDDDQQRAGLFYPGLAARTATPPTPDAFTEAAVLITAVDSARPILRRVFQLNPQHVLVPFLGL